MRSTATAIVRQLKNLLVRGQILSPVLQATTRPGGSGNGPDRTATRAGLSGKGRIQRLLVDVDAPVLAIDDDPHEIRARGGVVLPRNVHEQHRAQKGGVAGGAEQREPRGAEEALVAVPEIQCDVERPLVARAAVAVAGLAAKADTYIAQHSAVDDRHGRHLHVAVLEDRELALPSRGVETQENRPHHPFIEERLGGIFPDLIR